MLPMKDLGDVSPLPSGRFRMILVLHFIRVGKITKPVMKIKEPQSIYEAGCVV